jgi:hypothetical protein
MYNVNNIPIQGSPDAPSIDVVGKYTPVEYRSKIFRADGPIPVFSKNHSKQKQENNTLYQRNFPIEPKPLDIRPRGQYKVCQKYVDLSDPMQPKPPGRLPPVNPLQHSHNEFNPGIGKYSDFLNKIDVDSHLRQGYKKSECEEHMHKQVYCDTTVVDQPTLLDNPTCQNYKRYQFDDPNTLNVIPSNTSKIDAQSESVYRSDIVDPNLIYFNYANSNSTCMTPLPANRDLANVKQPLLFQQRPDIEYPNTLPLHKEEQNNQMDNEWSNCVHSPFVSDKEPYYGPTNVPSRDHNTTTLPVGPERTNQNLENIWNNVTKRKYI